MPLSKITQNFSWLLKIIVSCIYLHHLSWTEVMFSPLFVCLFFEQDVSKSWIFLLDWFVGVIELKKLDGFGRNLVDSLGETTFRSNLKFTWYDSPKWINQPWREQMEELHRLMTAIMWSSKIVSVNNENDMQSSTYHRQDEQFMFCFPPIAGYASGP